MICLRALVSLRHVAQAAVFCVFSSIAFAAPQQPIFPVLKYEPYAVPSPAALAEGDVNGDGTTDTLYATTGNGATTLTPALRNGTDSSTRTRSA